MNQGARSAAPPGPYSIAELGTDVLGLIRDYGVTTAAYCGISIGGMIGLWLAANAPERISDSRLTVIRGTSHLAPYQTPGPVTAAILGHLVG